MKQALFTLAVAVFLVVAGCSSSSSETSAVNTTAATSTSTVPTTSDVSTPNPVGARLDLTGDPFQPGLKLEATVFSVDQNSVPNAPKPGENDHWVAVDVETCLKHPYLGGTFAVSWNDWLVIADDTTRYDSAQLSELNNDLPTPAYPISKQPLGVDKCSRGWVMFPVPVGAEITTVMYRGIGGPAFWSAR